MKIKFFCKLLLGENMSALNICFLINYILCFFAIFGMIFIEHKKPVRIIAWSLALIIIPFGGLLLYVLIGYGLGRRTRRLLKKRMLYNNRYHESLQNQIEELSSHSQTKIDPDFKDYVMLNLKNANSVLTKSNDVKYFSYGPDMLESLKQDLLNAKKTINIMFYIFANDSTGKEIKDILVQKAKEGVRVKVLYDAIGSLKTHKFQFRKLKKAGGEVQEFFPAFMGLKLFNIRANYRNHRKIVVIDGKVGYMGGMNIRNDHMGKKKKVSPWRDCHIRICGPAIYSLQNIFISDWRLSSKKPEPQNYFLNEDYFCENIGSGDTAMQIVASAPTESEDRNIEEMMIKMIYTAQTSIKIQTPYFVPDEQFLMAIKMALLSGVKVEIIVPKKPDKQFVYSATLAYLKEVENMGAKIYLYHGFLHTKAVMVDDKILTMGSCNIDIRSFALNFEVNAVVYGEKDCEKFVQIFEIDKQNSTPVDTTYFKKLLLIRKMTMSFMKLFSAVL